MKVGKYLKEVSVVIIGVTITLIATNWISSRGEKKDLELYLQAVKMELEGNLAALEESKAYINQSYRLANYLWANKNESLNVDSLYTYRTIFQFYYFFIYKTGAFDMLKTSGAMRLIKDKELLIDIWNSYSALEFYKGEHDLYMKSKSDLMNEMSFLAGMDELTDMGIIEGVKQGLENPKHQKALSLFKNYGNVGDLDSCIAQLQKTIKKFR